MKKNLLFKLKKTMSLVLAFMMLTSVLSSMTFANAEGNEVTDETEKTENTFVDINESDWFYDHVNYMVDKGFMIGVADGEFAPNNTLTRAMVVQILYQISGSPELKYGYKNYFVDVDSDEWYTNSIMWACEISLVAGRGYNEDGRIFDPNGAVTRAELVTMLASYLKYRDVPVAAEYEYMEFADYDSIPDYAKSAVVGMKRIGAVSGRPGKIFDSSAHATRAEAATILHIFSEKLERQANDFTEKYGLTIGVAAIYDGFIYAGPTPPWLRRNIFVVNIGKSNEDISDLPEVKVSVTLMTRSATIDALLEENSENPLRFDFDELAYRPANLNMGHDDKIFADVSVTIGEETYSFIFFSNIYMIG